MNDHHPADHTQHAESHGWRRYILERRYAVMLRPAALIAAVALVAYALA